MKTTDVVLVAAGAFLVVAGVVLTAVQLVRGLEAPGRAARASWGRLNLSLHTTFPGLVLVLLGVLLLVIGAVTG